MLEFGSSIYVIATAMMMRIVILLCILMFASQATAQKQGLSGGDLLRACMFSDQLSSGKKIDAPPTAADAFMQGTCLGMINGVRFFAEEATKGTALATCIPEAVPVGQINSVVVRYLRNHPERLHENFFLLAVTASAEAWPCKK
jgi:hypothetical protein